MSTVRIPLHSSKYLGLYAIVDEEDAELVMQYRWNPFVRDRSVYAQTSVNGKTVYMHRLIMGANPGELVDHEDRYGLNNRRSNLRTCRSQQNSWNTAGLHQRKGIGYAGVWQRSTGRWVAEVHISGVKHTAGTFDDPEVAARARDRLAYHLRGEFAYLNFPEEAETVRSMTPAQRDQLITPRRRGRYSRKSKCERMEVR